MLASELGAGEKKASPWPLKVRWPSRMSGETSAPPTVCRTTPGQIEPVRSRSSPKTTADARTPAKEQAAAVETLADERSGDAGAAADFEQAVARLDGKRLDRPANPLRYHVGHVTRG